MVVNSIGREIMDEPTALNASTNPAQVPATTKRPRRGKWIKRLGAALLLLAVTVWFVPAILCATVLRHQVPQQLVPMIHAQVQWSDISLGWFSPVVIQGLKVADEAGQPLLEVQRISTSHSLWQLATQSSQLGKLTLVEPVVHVALRNDGSNLEDLIAKFTSTTPATPSNRPAPDVIVAIEKGRIELEHQASHRQSSFEQIAVRLVSTKGGVDELDLTIGQAPPTGQAEAAQTESASDWLLVHYGSPAADAAHFNEGNAKQATLKASHWKLDRFGPGLARVMPKAELAGELNASASLDLSPQAKGLDWDWAGTISIEKLMMAGIEAMKQDRLQLDQIAVSGRAATTHGRLAMNDLKLSADLGQLVATGDIPLDGIAQKSAAELIQSLLSDEDYHMIGSVDLKKLAAMLPQTLRIRDGIEITGGNVKVELVGDDSSGVRRWSGAAGIVGLTAENQGKKIPWDKPIIARATAHREKESLIVDQVECNADFLKIKGSGTLEDARFTATGDLSKLLENLEQFVDLGIEQLSGQLKVVGELKRVDETHVGLTSKVQLDNIAFEVSKNNLWREDHLELSINASGVADASSGLSRIETGEIHLIARGDAFDSKLMQPIDLTSKTPSYAIQADVKGTLASWQNRLRPFVALSDWKLGGTLDLETTVSMDSAQVNVSRFSIVLQQLEADGPGIMIQDPEMTLETTGRWELAAQKWTSPKTTLSGHSVSLEVDGLECELGPQGLAKLVGTAEYEADLKKVSHWINLATEKPSYYLLGMLSGTANLTQSGGVMNANLETQVEKLVVAGLSTPASGPPQWVAMWKEPQLKVLAKGAYDTSADKLSLESSSLSVDGLTVGAKGKLDACLSAQQIDLTGDIAYDWDKLVKRFGDQLSKHVQLQGQDHRPFAIKGSLASLSTGAASPKSSSPIKASQVSFTPDTAEVNKKVASNTTAGLMDFHAEGGLGWSAANVYGIVAGPADISAKLDQGVLQFAPLDVAVNEGKLHLTPAIHLENDPATLILPAEKIIDQVRLSPELCSGWLKFILPTLADSAQVEGKFSLDMKGASLPLSAPVTGSADGILTVNHVQVRPGPLALQIVGAIDQAQTLISRRSIGTVSPDQIWVQLPEQQIPFQLDQGRVHHDGLTITVNNVVVKTSGSVGLSDESLNMVAEIPIQAEWLGNNKTLQSLKGQLISIPIAGTLSKPKLDPRVFAKLTQQLGGSVIEGLIQDKIGGKLDGAVNKGLDLLFKGKK